MGLRWDVNHHLMLRAEYHRVHGTYSLPLADNPDLSQTEGNWDMFALLVTVHF